MNQTRPKVKRSRALGIALTPKCVRYFERRPFPPGQHGRARRTTSDYKVRLLEKQRLKAQYDLHEGQLRRAFDRAVRRPGKTGEELIVELESRLDALVLRAGFARTIYQARQVVTHQHVTVNGRRLDRPSARLQPGDVIAVAERSRGKAPFLAAAAGAHAPERLAPYLEVSLPGLTARLTRLPLRSEVPVLCEEQLVVEYYSR
ncbi:30S ribosomal protein S4 [Micromonospora parathelypteridis]|uniref:Small ribosomal subunit protein uS4 n=1 Tax=Micromonospora parathelypteridis TaxID=1839617 RepID=A0A840VPH3_9ACTN|nr:30S ribosomal protein S4 [Micromonospora parathelypteridis]MBB5475944.1 small subunit ribosomal protein S4 [Micromonospora parathelypteridis]GGO32126.1 30S ribosomal protein S4 [Micromonospora parathelypteridis]